MDSKPKYLRSVEFHKSVEKCLVPCFIARPTKSVCARTSLYNVFSVFDFEFQGWVDGNPDAKLLYDELLVDYNRLIRPVPNASETVVVNLSIRLSQLIDVVRLSSLLPCLSFHTK